MARTRHTTGDRLLGALVVLLASATACVRPVRDEARPSDALVLTAQGSFAVGGTVVTSPGTFDARKPSAAGATLHGDHAYVFYQVPADARPLPLVFWHGAGQSKRTWETTVDGREGFQNIFLRRHFAVYLIDQPRRGAAGRSTVAAEVPATTDDQMWFGMFRIGVWPDYFPGVQFSSAPAALDQYFRAMTPNTGPYDAEINARAVVALFTKIGPSILVTHSQSGGPGWLTVMKSSNVRAVVSYEPGSGFVFPEGEVPAAMPSLTGLLEGVAVPRDQFTALTKIPIVLYFGDNIPEAPSPNPGQDNWRVRLAMARLWRDTVNRHGGRVTLVHLPDIGIHGNTHFPFSDTNNIEIAKLLSRFLAEQRLDGGARRFPAQEQP
jgi:pimeloyl-ACP methyl ester carboxylesterase